MRKEIAALFENMLPIYQRCDRAHDQRHIRRVLALRETYWPVLEKEKATANIDPFVLDLAIIFHDLDRNLDFRGKDEKAVEDRADFIRLKVYGLNLGESTITAIINAAETNHKPRSDSDSPLRTLLSDLECCDVGAVGVLRMADVAASRGYGYGKARNFDPSLSATEGDENLDSVTDDIRFCLDWYNGPEKFRIQNSAIKILAEHRFNFLQMFFNQLKKEFEETGTL